MLCANCTVPMVADNRRMTAFEGHREVLHCPDCGSQYIRAELAVDDECELDPFVNYQALLRYKQAELSVDDRHERETPCNASQETSLRQQAHGSAGVAKRSY